MKKVVTLITILILLIVSTQAFAVPAWCYQYIITGDSFQFDGITWSPWGTAQTGKVIIGDTEYARPNPYNNSAARFIFYPTDATNSMLFLDKTVHATSYQDYRYFPNNSSICPNMPRPNPPGTAKFCIMGAWIRSLNGASGGIQILDPNTTAILGQTFFSYPANTPYTNVAIPYVLNCPADVIFRIWMIKQTGSISMVVDDPYYYWYY